MLIPQIFHYVWLGSKPMHPLMNKWRDRWRSLHPGWQIHVWQESDKLPQHKLISNNEILECRHPEYLARCPTYAKRSDVWRYDLLEQRGGIYLDTDMEPVRNLEPLLKDKAAFAGLCDTRGDWHLRPGGLIKTEVACSIMGATPHHPWLQELIAGVPSQDPIEQLSLAFPYLTRITGHHPDIHLFPQTTFYPVTWHDYAPMSQHSIARKKLPDDAYAVHRWSSRWFPNGLKRQF